MSSTTLSPAETSKPAQAAATVRVAISATFTAEPIEPFLQFWLNEMGMQGGVEFAPYNQIFQELLDPTSLLATNRAGVNLVLVRLEDWARFKAGGWDEPTIATAADELAESLRGFAERNDTPTFVCVTPPSPAVESDSHRTEFLAALQERVRTTIAPYESLHWIGPESLNLDSVQHVYDEVADRVGHMPYTPAALVAIATAVARRIHLVKFSPYKVVVLDCDNTLWGGVVGEDGPHGVTLGPGMKALQEFIVAQQAAGMLVCLQSKNSEADVLNAFDVRPDFPLRREHLVSWRINWLPKSLGLSELAAELNLGLDSFVFLDDNPVEVAEVQAALPQVLALRVPPEGEIADLLPHLWAFDRLKVTDEDRKRTLMYRQNSDRLKLEQQAGDISAFLASLDLSIRINPPSDDQWARVSQLTQRTNQFNFTTVRRSEAEIRQAARAGLECLCVEVSDRFGEYGLVGVMIFSASADALAIDTLLLSCRVLGRGVEHAMLARLGQLAVERGLPFVEARLVPTSKNEPAANFLNSVAAEYASPTGDAPGTIYRIPASVASGMVYRPGDDAKEKLEFARTGGKSDSKSKPSAKSTVFDKSAFYTRVFSQLRDPNAVLRELEKAAKGVRTLETPVAEAQTAMQFGLLDLWSGILRVDPIGVDDEFTALGGTSIQCARLFVEIESSYGVRLPMSTILEAPTIRLLADRIAAASRGDVRGSLKPLKVGAEGGPTLFLIHDGDGETLLYLNLARRLGDDVNVYGLEPYGNDHCPMLHTRVPEMAAYYLSRVREVCPEGPYLLGGLCAGGVIAFEMALQLRADGQEVGLVALLDSSDARAAEIPFLNARRRLARFTGSSSDKTTRPSSGNGEEMATQGQTAPPEAKLGRLVRKGTRAFGKIANVVRYEAELAARRKAEAAKIRAVRAATDRGERPEGPTGLNVRAVYDHAERSYTPSQLLDSPVLLVRAGADGKAYPDDEPLLARLRDPLFGWGSRVAGGASKIEVVDAPGGHGGILREPHVADVALRVQSAIDRAFASTATANVGR